MTAPLSSRILMFPREIPHYLSVAYSLRFQKTFDNEFFITKICRVFKQVYLLIKEILTYRPHPTSFERNIVKLDADFEKLNGKLSTSDKPICAYFVSSKDSNGSIIGDHLYYYHHYKIQNFEKHFAVTAKVVRSAEEIYAFLKTVKAQYPTREIQVVDIVSHGETDSLSIPTSTNAYSFNISDVKENQFEDCAKDAVIILDACHTGRTANGIAATIANKNPGKKVMASEIGLYFSKPVFKRENEKISISYVTHGPAIFRAYTMRIFSQPLV